ncbi:STN domain-containing protein, partial [Pseudomonas sp. Env-94]
MLVIRSALLSLALAGAALADVPAQWDSVTVRTYHIDPGPLGATLSSFAVDAGIALSFLPALTEGLTSPGLSGRYSPQEAVTRLLAGSGLDMVQRSDGSYTLVPGQVTLSDITVSAPEPRASDL